MTRPTCSTTVVDPATLDAAQRAALTDALYASHCAVFEGVDRATFGAYVVDSPAEQTRILVLRDGGGAVRGYAAFHVFEHLHLGRQALVVRMEIAAEPAFRRMSFAGPFIVSRALELAVRHPGVPRYFFACFVHPSAYVSLCRHAPRVWPRPGVETPPHIEALMLGLRRRFGLKPVGEEAVQVGWIARDCRRPPSRLSPEAAFYLARNPGHVRGEGLPTIVDFGTPAVVRGSLDFAGHWLRRRAAGGRGAGQRAQRAQGVMRTV